MASTRRLFRRVRKRGRKTLRSGRKVTKRRVRPLLDRIGFTSRKRFLFFRFTPQGRALRPFAKAIGL